MVAKEDTPSPLLELLDDLLVELMRIAGAVEVIAAHLRQMVILLTDDRRRR